MSGKLVTLVGVETIVEAEVTMSMLRAYGIYTNLQSNGRGEPYSISVVDADFETARALLSDIDRTE
ncbi:hypothetical protein GGQ64_000587 [Rhizobium azooxidifex]|uniref:DUF2007 domain-containing protein n=1 Tax=Mycoplana azooxidifex TaxID=1636188 RepID=A0A7W6D2A2_9HYPH|nr:hypothetical protein [Mycoplana azooxidifex]MBB3975411.1 hypothetical protein [Mycoplana azooxidifex]